MLLVSVCLSSHYLKLNVTLRDFYGINLDNKLAINTFRHISNTHTKKYVLSEDGQELGQKHFWAIMNKNILQLFVVKHYKCNTVVRRMTVLHLYTLLLYCNFPTPFFPHYFLSSSSVYCITSFSLPPNYFIDILPFPLFPLSLPVLFPSKLWLFL